MEGAIHEIYFRPVITVLVLCNSLPFITLQMHINLLGSTVIIGRYLCYMTILPSQRPITSLNATSMIKSLLFSPFNLFNLIHSTKRTNAARRHNHTVKHLFQIFCTRIYK